MMKSEVRQVVNDKDIVRLIGIEEINPTRRLYKSIFKNMIIRDFEKVTRGRWEAAMLIKEANEHAIKYERSLGKRKDQLTTEEKEYIKDTFFDMKLKDLTDEHADELVKHLSHVFGDKFEAI